ncbi:MAG: hypothetical protein OXU74_16555 [Gemmatimonadota bacterium]|nr:hypothetical protein [Gemmatimonadota bacterium]
MFEHFLPFIVTAVLGFVVQPPITEVGFHGGPHWPDTSKRELHVMVGATAHTPLDDRFGVQFGAAYTQRGRSWSCWLITCFEDWDRGYTQSDFIDMSLLGQVRLPLDDAVGLQAVLGPKYGVEVVCRSENHTQGTERECSRPIGARYDVRLVAGVGVAIQASPRVDVTVNYRYGFDLQQWGFWDWVDGDSDQFESSLIAGVTYRIAR